MNRKAQLKIQEMAFVLVAIFIFFALVGLLFISFRAGSLQDSAQDIKEDSTRELLRNIAGTPELSWRGCAGCIDLDKAVVLDESVGELLELNYLKIERVYPESAEGECLLGKYPNCNELTLVDSRDNKGITSSAWAALCRWDFDSKREVCELGKVIASGSGLNDE